jgi:hypothetical protein
MRGLALLTAALLLAGCSLGGDGGDATVEQGELKGVVLQPGDLPASFVRFDEGRQAIADAPAGARSDPERFGRIEGWKARYRRAGSTETTGPLVVESRADVFESVSGAEDDLAAFETAGYTSIEAPAMGDETRAFETLQSGAGEGVRYYQFAWRKDNATASLLVSGFEGKLTLEEAVELARKQAERLSRAAASG